MSGFNLDSFVAAAKRVTSSKVIQEPGTSTLSIDEVKELGLDPNKFAKTKEGIARGDLSANQIKKLEAVRLKAFPADVPE